MGQRWLIEVAARPGMLVSQGELGTSSPHAHQSVHVFVSPDRELVLTDAQGRRERCAAAVIPAGVRHSIVRGAESAMMVHLEPNSVAAHRLGVRHADSVRDWVGHDRMVGEWVRREIGDEPRRHRAVAETLLLIDDLVRAGAQVRLSSLAREAGLSESRLAHLFTGEVGLTLRAHVRWLRTVSVVGNLRSGKTLTELAHDAGFADSAHLTRVSRKVFGIAPSKFVQGAENFPAAS